jgi:hypothetical protein
MVIHDKLLNIKKGQSITAAYLNNTTRVVNAGNRAIRAPIEVLQSDEEIRSGGGGSSIGDEIFNSTSVTESTQTATDSGGDTVPLERVDTIVFTEQTTGRTVTMNITYP